jgi:hypothetical protein
MCGSGNETAVPTKVNMIMKEKKSGFVNMMANSFDGSHVNGTVSCF